MSAGAESNSEPVIVRQGYLKKKSPKALGKGKVVDVWQKRYFVLTTAQLKYYKDKQGAETSTSSRREPLKMIAMAQVHSAAANPKHHDMLTIDLGAERKVKPHARTPTPTRTRTRTLTLALALALALTLPRSSCKRRRRRIGTRGWCAPTLARAHASPTVP